MGCSLGLCVGVSSDMSLWFGGALTVVRRVPTYTSNWLGKGLKKHRHGSLELGLKLPNSVSFSQARRGVPAAFDIASAGLRKRPSFCAHQEFGLRPLRAYFDEPGRVIWRTVPAKRGQKKLPMVNSNL
jgi:hypothetical protein